MGNPDCHVILRGGRRAPNYQAGQLGAALGMIARGRAGPAGDGGRQPRQQRQGLPPPAAVADDLAGQVGAGETGIIGVMLESFLLAGRQEPGDPATLAYGQSVTDACLDFGTTADVLRGLAAAVRRRRGAVTLAAADRAAAPAP